MQDHVVLDVEIQQDPAAYGWDNTHLLGVSVAVVYEHASDRFKVYTAGQVPELQDRLRRADRITGFNHVRFDLPVIFAVQRGTEQGRLVLAEFEPRCNDLLLRVWAGCGLGTEQFTSAHKGWGLDPVARGTLGRGKIGHGAHAVELYRQERWGELVTYCADDVALTRDLAAFADRHGFLRRHPDGRCVELRPSAN